MKYTSIEICAGAGGQAIGLERAGFEHLALVEIDPKACATLRLNRPNWNVLHGDVKHFSPRGLGEVDLFSGGVPCPPFSIAGKQLGHLDERDLFPEALRIASLCLPKAIMLENVKGILDKKFDTYRNSILEELDILGYQCRWDLINSSDHGVSQLRPRAILVALRKEYFPFFVWPEKSLTPPQTVGQLLLPEMQSLGWSGAVEWSLKANTIAPTLVGGSKKHGGADLGPSRAKRAWSNLGVDGAGLADAPPSPEFERMPRLTLKMAAMIQGFPNDWKFAGGKTSAYRQVGNAFPPPVAYAMGKSIIEAFKGYESQKPKTERLQSKIA